MEIELSIRILLFIALIVAMILLRKHTVGNAYLMDFLFILTIVILAGILFLPDIEDLLDNLIGLSL